MTSSKKRRPPVPPQVTRVPKLDPAQDERALRRLIWFYTRRKDWAMVERLTHDLGLLFEDQDRKKLATSEVETEVAVGK